MRRCITFWYALQGERPALVGARMIPGPHGPVVVPFTRRGAIPPLAIVRWAEFKGIDPEVSDLILDVLHRLDDDRAEAEASREQTR